MNSGYLECFQNQSSSPMNNLIHFEFGNSEKWSKYKEIAIKPL